jgi:hypothetical protein
MGSVRIALPSLQTHRAEPIRNCRESEGPFPAIAEGPSARYQRLSWRWGSIFSGRNRRPGYSLAPKAREFLTWLSPANRRLRVAPSGRRTKRQRSPDEKPRLHGRHRSDDPSALREKATPSISSAASSRCGIRGGSRPCSSAPPSAARAARPAPIARRFRC